MSVNLRFPLIKIKRFILPEGFFVHDSRVKFSMVLDLRNLIVWLHCTGKNGITLQSLHVEYRKWTAGRKRFKS